MNKGPEESKEAELLELIRLGEGRLLHPLAYV
jgi:hypothetical protein